MNAYAGRSSVTNLLDEYTPHHPGMTNFLGVPIVFKGRVIGDLYLTNKIGAPEFTQDDETIVTLFPAQAAVAIENARLFDKETRRSSQLHVLNRIGRELTLIFDLDTLLHTVADLMTAGFGYQNVQVLWVDRAHGFLRVRALAGRLKGAVTRGTARPIDQGIAGWVAENRRTVLCNDVTQDPRYVAIPGLETSSEVAVPVLVKDEVVAVVHVAGMEPYAFDESDVKTLETLADQLSVAVENIHLQQQQRDQSQRLAVVEERDRIGRDLHDGVIQSIYAVGLTLEDNAGQTEQEPGEVRSRIEGPSRTLTRSYGIYVATSWI